MRDDNSKEPTDDLRGAVIVGSAWMVGMRWAVRGLGLVSMVILARLLDPSDFGLVAMGMLFISLLDILTSFGVDLALIQRQDAGREHSDTAWTIRLMQAVVVAVGVVAVAPLAADYFDEPRVTKLMQFLSVSIALTGLENIGIVAFRKELEFNKEFHFRVGVKLGSFILTLILAILWRDYWALAWGVVAGRTFAVVLSYVVHPYRPRLSLSKIGDIWSFSQWMLLRNIGMYARRQIDAFMVGHYFSTFQMGLYRVSTDVAQLPTTELVWPMRRALFPGYAKLSHEPRRLGLAFLKVIGMLTAIGMPAGVGVALVADPLVEVVLSEKWSGAGPIVAWLALYSVFLTLSTGVQAPLMALGRMRRMVGLVWAQMLVAVPAIVLAALQGRVVMIAQAQALTALVLLPVFFYTLTSIRIIRWREILVAIWRPVAASAVMAGCLLPLGDTWGAGAVVQLLVKVPLGAAAYALVSYLLWRRSGRPEGAERVILDLVRVKIPWLRPASGA